MLREWRGRGRGRGARDGWASEGQHRARGRSGRAASKARASSGAASTGQEALAGGSPDLAPRWTQDPSARKQPRARTGSSATTRSVAIAMGSSNITRPERKDNNKSSGLDGTVQTVGHCALEGGCPSLLLQPGREDSATSRCIPMLCLPSVERERLLRGAATGALALAEEKARPVG